MLYVKRNEQGELADFSFSPTPGYEIASLEDPAIRAWLSRPENQPLVDEALQRMDLEMARAVEDLIEMLIEKGVILFTDLPEAVQNKILFKRSIRSLRSQEMANPSDEEELLL
ncbi:hypothetical protein [Sulfurivirga sp.]|uniref:hypothetical protein n=1 Tax=Sulfurivirga sp. TaxID=2614236 RepID=UPI0025D08CBF|nr:hypothetical protein [Sulfurivirga sp.]